MSEHISSVQGVLDFGRDRARLVEIHERLDLHFGKVTVNYLRLDALSQFVMSLLGGRTKSETSKAAFIRLLRRLGRWDAVRDADLGEVYSCVSSVTFAEAKAPRLQHALRIISDRSDCPTLEHIASMTTPQAERALETLPGVGPKVSSSILNFSVMQRRSLVVDTHHLRVMFRLGFLRL